MKMFLDFADHSAYLLECLEERPSRIFISSYGLYAGITYSGQDTTQWGEKYKLATRDLMEGMRSIPVKDVHMLIGVAPYKSCRRNSQCLDCETKYTSGLIRFAHHAAIFPEFQWKVSTELHLKCALFFYPDRKTPRGVAGGRNFSDSTWADVTFTLDQSNIYDLFKHSMNIWTNSRPLNDNTVSELLVEQGISQQGFEAVLGDSKLPF